MMRLNPGEKYETGNIVFAGWVRGGEDEPTGAADRMAAGYSCWDYFDRDGVYLGPDEHGIEPLFVNRTA